MFDEKNTLARTSEPLNTECRAQFASTSFISCIYDKHLALPGMSTWLPPVRVESYGHGSVGLQRTWGWHWWRCAETWRFLPRPTEQAWGFPHTLDSERGNGEVLERGLG